LKQNRSNNHQIESDTQYTKLCKAFDSLDESQFDIVIDSSTEKVHLDARAQQFFVLSTPLPLNQFDAYFTPANKLIETAPIRSGTNFRYRGIDKEVHHLSAYETRTETAPHLKHIRFKRIDLFDPSKLTEIEEKLINQRQLFAIISHEMRTPVATLQMLIEDLEQGAPSPKHTEQMKNTVDHLMSVLQDMTQAVNPERALPISKTAFHPNQLLIDAHSQLTRLAELNGMVVKLELIDNENIRLESDKQRIKIIALNLIKNAIHHSKGSTINVKVEWIQRVDKGYLVLTVSDDGQGIPKEATNKIFEPFERLGTKVDGSGLGLFIVRQSLNELHGDVDVDRNEQSGARFVVKIPMVDLNAKQSEPVFRQESKDTGDLLKRLNLLVVEDDPIIRMVSKNLLGKLVNQVDVAENGHLGYEMATRKEYDLILSDFFMPVLDGRQMIQKLRKEGVSVPIVAVTAAVMGQESEALLDAGANKVIAKPISMNTFLEVVEQCVAR
jgi:two-component system, sensor histidine kinase